MKFIVYACDNNLIGRGEIGGVGGAMSRVKRICISIYHLEGNYSIKEKQLVFLRGKPKPKS
jgi:hypothetical protein